MHIKRDIYNWNINIILRVLIEGGNPELLSTICLLSATIEIKSPTNQNPSVFSSENNTLRKLPRVGYTTPSNLQ